ncbi:MAG TPA: hypothetical protein VF395_03960, partial [Polyangiaceae bacterium]
MPLDALAGAQGDRTRNLIADSIHLGVGATFGDIQTAHFSGPGSIHGTVSGVVPLPPLPGASPVTVGASGLTVAALATVTTGPGRYATVTVNAGGTLRLRAGLFEVASVTVAAGGRIEALGSIQIHVAGRFSAGDGAFVGPAAGAAVTASGVRVEISGQNGSTGALSASPKAAAFGVGDQIRALLLVPNGSLTIGSADVLRAAFFGRDVDVGIGAQLTFEDGFPDGTCSTSCDDANPCTADACVSGACTHVAVPAGTSCSDGNACTTSDTCAGGVCVGGAAP